MTIRSKAIDPWRTAEVRATVRGWRVAAIGLEARLGEWLAVYPAPAIAHARFLGDGRQTAAVIRILQQRYHDLTTRRRQDATGATGVLLYLDTLVADDLLPWIQSGDLAAGGLVHDDVSP